MSWKKLLFKDFITLQRGFDLPKTQMKEGEVPVLGSNCIIGYHNEAKVAPQGVVTGRSGTLGVVQFIEKDFWPHNTALWVKDFKGNIPRFVYYKLQTLHLENFNGGASVPTLNRNVLDTLPVNVPDIDTQSKIATTLSNYDDLIENNRRRIQLLERSLHLLYKEWFVHLRFPSHEHSKIVDGIPEGWSKIPLGEALTLQRGFDLPTAERKNGKYPVFASTGINGYHDQYKVKAPCVVTGRSGSLGTVLYVVEDFWPLNTTLWGKEFKLVEPLIALYLLRSLKLEQYNGGAAVPTLNRNDVHRIEFSCPPKKLQEFFLDVANPIYSQMRVLEQQNVQLKQARDLLLPKLMSGAIGV
jgi:type I restriction enzyme S subunit